MSINEHGKVAVSKGGTIALSVTLGALGLFVVFLIMGAMLSEGAEEVYEACMKFGQHIDGTQRSMTCKVHYP